MDSCSSYENKKKLLFESLTSAESCIKGTSLEQTDRVSVHSTQTSPSKTVSRKFQGKESIFKRPEAPIQKCLRPRRQPDYQVNLSHLMTSRMKTLQSNRFQLYGENRQIHTNGRNTRWVILIFQTIRIHRPPLPF